MKNVRLVKCREGLLRTRAAKTIGRYKVRGGIIAEWENTYIQSAYKNPPKHHAAITMRTTNCIIIARSANTIRLFFNVTNASLLDAKPR